MKTCSTCVHWDYLFGGYDDDDPEAGSCCFPSSKLPLAYSDGPAGTSLAMAERRVTYGFENNCPVHEEIK